ncbi:MAG: hypothetical protein BMS9Abin11_0015 [Gammaproteobacteria bacterium]|nr:MAG: hypothetical protein BMS9Abin11_0015 [Gammaproteobacteria bacterium]
MMDRNCKRLLPWIAVFYLLLPACTATTNDANTRAKEFMQVLIEKPDQTNELLRLSNQQDVLALQHLSSALPTEVALRYLRASFQQGKYIRYSVKTLEQTVNKQHKARVKIRRQRSNKQRPDVLLFYITMIKTSKDEWQIVKIEVPDPG